MKLYSDVPFPFTFSTPCPQYAVPGVTHIIRFLKRSEEGGQLTAQCHSNSHGTLIQLIKYQHMRTTYLVFNCFSTIYWLASALLT